jgi:hypothetical protein
MWFDENQAYKSSGGGIVTPDSILTYTAPSPKLVYGSDGVLGYANHNVLTYSEQFDNAAWVKSNASVTGASINAAVAPDGTTTADALLDTAVSDIHRVTQSFTAAAAGRTYTVSAYLKKSTLDYAAIGITDISGGSLYAVAVFNLAAGTVSTSGAEGTGYSVVPFAPLSVGNGWYRCSVVVVAGTSASFLRAVVSTNKTGVITGASGGSEVYLGNGSGIFVWGAQLNAGSSALTYIPTTTAAVYSLPRDYNPTTGAALGVLVEEARTNFQTESQTITAWADITALTATANQTTAPDGTTTADLLTEVAASNQHFTFGTRPTVTSGVTYSGSMFFKKGPGATAPDWVQITVNSAGFGSAGYANFNLTTGVVGVFNGLTSASIQDVGGGWYRCTITLAATSTTTATIVLALINNDNLAGRLPTYTGAVTANVYVWGAQLEAGSFATSYIPTVASQVTRAADQISILTSAFPYSATAGTMVAEFKAPLALAQDVVWIANGLAESLAIYLNSTSQALLWARDGGVTQAADLMPGTLTGATDKVAYAFAADDFAASLNRNSVVTDTSGTMPTPTSLVLVPRSVSSASANIHIKRLAYYAVRKSNAELQVLSS